MKTRLTTSCVAVALATGSFVATPALAQDDEADLGIEEIVVSARKRDESLQDVPVAVSAFRAEDLANRVMRDIADISRHTPGLSFAKAFGRSTDRPVIRGQGNVLAGVQFGVESGAAYFVDGIYYPGDLSSIDLNGLERVEIIRGPQAALYGRNTYSGAINFVTRGIRDTIGGNLNTRFGQDGYQELIGSIGGPLSDTVGFNLNGRYYSYDGEYTNIVTDQIVGDEETTSVSGRLDFTPSDGFTLSLRGTYQQDRDGTRPFFLQPSEANNCQPGTRSNAAWLFTGSTNNNQYYCGDINRPGDTVQLNDQAGVNTVVVPGIPDATLPGFTLPFPGSPVPDGLFPGGDPYSLNDGLAFSGVDRDISYFSITGDWEFESGWFLHATAAIRDEERKTGSDSDHTSVNFLSAPFNPAPANETVECTFCASGQDDYSDYSAEFRLQSPSDRATRWLFGGFIYDQEQESSDITFAGIDPVDTIATIENVAVFASVEHDFSDALSASFELRWFDETKGREEVGDATFENSFTEVAPRLTLNYSLNDNTMLYGIYAKGFKPGGVIGSDGADLVPPTTTYEQEESDNFELGIKTTSSDGRLVANAAVFFIDASDIQLTTPLADGGSGSLTSVVTNQGSGETFGIEVDLKYALSENLLVGATYALADTEFTEGCDDFQWTMTSGGGILEDATACTGVDPNGQGNGSIVGNQFPLASKNQFSAFADFRRPIGAGDREFFANLSYSWEDEKPVQVHNFAWVPAATIVDLQLGISGDNWSARVYGRNLTDEDAPSMVTRWLQDPLLSIYASGPFGALVSETAAGAPAGACDVGAGCSTNFPRAFFGDMRMGRNFGVEFTLSYGN